MSRKKRKTERMFPSKNKKRKKPWWADLATYRRPKKKKDDMKYLLMILYMLGRRKRSGGGRRRHSGGGKGFLPRARRGYNALQRCVIKMSYGNDSKSSIEFLTKYMQQLEKDGVTDKPKLFSDEPVTKGSLEKAKAGASERFYRFIISPEKNGVNLEVLTKILVKKMEVTMGRKLRWYAAVHKDTDHNHVHLWIDGTDRNGRKIDMIPRKLVTQDVRTYAQEIITAQIGPRSKQDVELQRAGMYRAARFTILDKRIQDRQLRLPAMQGGKWMFVARAESQADKERFATLTDLELAKKHEHYPNAWYLEADWAEKLMAANNNNVFFKARKSLKKIKAENLSLYSDTEPIRGVVTRVFSPNWEDTWKGAYVVENEKLGKAWFVSVPGNRPVDDELAGTEVTVINKVNKNGFKYPVVFKRGEKSKAIAR